MSIEVVPDLLDGIEFGRVGGEVLEVKPGEGVAHRIDGTSLVDLSAIPEQDDVSTQVGEQQAQEPGDVHSLEIVLPKLKVETQARTPGYNREDRDGRDPVVLVVVANDRGASSRVPSPTARRNEHEPGIQRDLIQFRGEWGNSYVAPGRTTQNRLRNRFVPRRGTATRSGSKKCS